MNSHYDSVAFIDYETFWDVGFSLKSPKISTTDYIHDRRFAVHGAAVGIGYEEPRWLWGEELDHWVRSNQWRRFVAHHALFDGYITRHWYGSVYEDYFCTMGMIEALFQGSVGHGLEEAMKSLLGWESGKSDILSRTKGRYWVDFTDLERQEMALYACKDLKATQALFYQCAPALPRSEWQVMSTILKMFCDPKLEFNEELLRKTLLNAHEDREQEIDDALTLFRCTEADLSGNNTFLALLESVDFKVPMKPSPSKEGVYIPAFAKTDKGFQDMLESDDPRVAALAKGRLAVKSTQGITRAQRFLDLHEKVGHLPVAYNYYRAHTGRLSGANKINLANLKRGSDLRKSIVAPKGFRIGVADSSQIECRADGYLAGQENLMALFRAKEDPYNDMASDIFGRTVDRKNNPDDFLAGFIGKTATLGLGFQMGGPKFKLTVETNAKTQLGLDYPIDIEEAYRVVDVYRRKNWKIVEFWKAAQNMLHAMAFNLPAYDFEYADDALHIDTKRNKIWFPNGTYLFYPCLDYDPDTNSFTYQTKMGKNYISRYIYGGKTVENIVQKFARDIVVWQMLQIAEEFPVVLHTYDENVALIPEETADEALEWMLQVMTTSPPWAKSLPLGAEGGHEKEYSK